MLYFINIGSNTGDRRLNLSRAVRLVSEYFGLFEISHAVETEPWGYDSDNKFLNIGMMFRSDMEPIEVLHTLQNIEKEICPDPHRNPDGTYRDRVIDIDIVAIDMQVIDIPELRIPHPHMAERTFYLEPMAELAPLWHHPLTNLTPSEMLSQLKLDE